MGRYRVYHTFVSRGGKVVLGVEIEGEARGDDGLELTVEGQPGRVLRMLGGRIVFDGNDISNRRILIVERPDFPVEQLRGQVLSSRRADSSGSMIEL